MKIHNYEKRTVILLVSILLIGFEIASLAYLTEKKEYEYEKITGYIIKKNYVLITPNKQTRDLIYQNKKIFVKNKNLSYEIEEDKGIVWEEAHEKYYEVTLKIHLPSIKTNIIEMSIKKQRKDILAIFKSVWKGE